jgi:hypothetical protein
MLFHLKHFLTAVGMMPIFTLAWATGKYQEELALGNKFNILNANVSWKTQHDPATAASVHKLPAPYVLDTTSNLLTLSESIVEDLRSPPALPGQFSTLSKLVLDAYHRHVLKSLDEYAVPSSQGITADQARLILKLVHNHPVAGIPAMEIYDPIKPNKQRTHGFCFGRADLVFWELLKLEVPKSSILKLFQIGSINGDPTMGRAWSNHIVTIVRAKTGGWYAIDPFYNEIMTPAQWYQKNVNFTSNGRTMLYIGSPHRMYAQGGENTIEAIWDLDYPLSRSSAKDSEGKKHENLFVFKDGVWQKYYSDLLKSVIPESIDRDSDRLFCGQSSLCSTSKTENE